MLIQKFKKYIFLALITFGVAQNSAYAVDNSIKQYTPENTVFAFDYHDVIAQATYMRYVYYALLALDLPLIPTHVISYFNDIRVWEKEIKGGYKVINNLVGKYPALLRHKSLMLGIADSWQPNPSTVSVLKDLKQQGFKLYLASNMEQDAFETQKNRWPELFALFDDYCVVQKPLATEKKPNAIYYQNLRNLVNKHNPHQPHIIFVDDSKTNIKGAQQAPANITPILFKSALQFCKDLKAVGINCQQQVKSSIISQLQKMVTINSRKG